ncbi:MAG: hypothetical protein HN416_12155 [Nitrospina sp.]|nr:hypothetical protein [Nitrospina sp.]
MAIYNGMEAAHDHLMEVAKACILAAGKAPTLTHRLELMAEIVTDEDMDPIIDVLATLGETSAFQRHDAVAYQSLKKQNKMPPVLLIGADLMKPAMWDCGACGFKTCGEYLKYSKTNKGVGIAGYGPSCVWKAIDFGTACDYACACVAQHHAESRIMASIGACAMLLGHLEGSTMVLGLPIGPVGKNLWFDREAWKDALSFDQRMMTQLAGGPTNQMAFSGGGNPIIKSKPTWWEDPTYMKIEQDENLVEAEADGLAKAYEKIMGYAGVLDDDE